MYDVRVKCSSVKSVTPVGNRCEFTHNRHLILLGSLSVDFRGLLTILLLCASVLWPSTHQRTSDAGPDAAPSRSAETRWEPISPTAANHPCLTRDSDQYPMRRGRLREYRCCRRALLYR